MEKAASCTFGPRHYRHYCWDLKPLSFNRPSHHQLRDLKRREKGYDVENIIAKFWVSRNYVSYVGEKVWRLVRDDAVRTNRVTLNVLLRAKLLKSLPLIFWSWFLMFLSASETTSCAGDHFGVFFSFFIKRIRASKDNNKKRQLNK